MVIPTYNSASYIVEAIESVLGQTFRNFEIIVVDDGSTDQTRSVVAPYVNLGAIQYLYQANKGPGAARNAGILSARGDYIAFLDADDVLTQESLERRVGLMRRDPKVEWVFGDYYCRTEGDLVRRPETRDILTYEVPFARSTPDGFIIDGEFRDILNLVFSVWTGTVLIEKRLLEKAGLFRTDLMAGEDTDMWIRVAQSCKTIGYVNEPLAYYNLLRGNLSVTDPARYCRNRLQFLFDLLAKYGSEGKICRIVKRHLAYVYYDLGCYFYREGILGKAQWSQVVSVFYDPWNPLPYRFLLLSLIPRRVRSVLRTLLAPIVPLPRKERRAAPSQ